MNDDCCYKLYMHVNKTNGKVYIGQTKHSYISRWNNGKGYGHCSRFAKAIKKYGWDSFEHIPLIEGLSKIEVDYFERFFIGFFDSQNPDFGYNITSGGDENPLDNPVVRAKHGESMKKRSANIEWRENVRKAIQNRSANIEWRENVRKANQKKFADPEWQKKVREANQKRRKPVLCVETKIVYNSLTEAAVAVNLRTPTPICLCCGGKQKTAGGYQWEYA